MWIFKKDLRAISGVMVYGNKRSGRQSRVVGYHSVQFATRNFSHFLKLLCKRDEIEVHRDDSSH